MSAAKQMQMQVVHRLATIVSCINDDPVTIIQLLVTSNCRCRGHQMTHQRSIFGQRLCR